MYTKKVHKILNQLNMNEKLHNNDKRKQTIKCLDLIKY